MFYRTLPALVVVFSLTILLAHGDLYQPDGPVTVVGVDNFHRVIFDASNGWLVVFFAHWCGHCVRFAPYWTNFAEKIKGGWLIVR